MRLKASCRAVACCGIRQRSVVVGNAYMRSAVGSSARADPPEERASVFAEAATDFVRVPYKCRIVPRLKRKAALRLVVGRMICGPYKGKRMDFVAATF